jgi:hypothetical protein
MYTLRKLGTKAFVEISAQEFSGLRLSKTAITNIVAIEEKFDTLLGNYLELEHELMKITASYMIYEMGGNVFRSNMNTINRRMVNLMTSCRLYNDQTAHHFSVMFGKVSQEFESLKSEMSRHFDRNIEYRTMEALRNYVQHRGYPVGGYTLQNKWVQKGEKKEDAQLIHLKLDLRSIEEDGDFKKKTLNELIEIENSIDLKQHFRKYVECISLVHGRVRELTSNVISNAEQNIILAREKYKTKFEEGDSELIAAVHENDEGRVVEKHYLSVEQMNYRRYYLEKNKPLINLARRYVTSEIPQQ